MAAQKVILHSPTVQTVDGQLSYRSVYTLSETVLGVNDGEVSVPITFGTETEVMAELRVRAKDHANLQTGNSVPFETTDVIGLGV